MTHTNVRSVYSGRATNWPMLCVLTALVIPFIALAAGSNGSWRSASFLLPLALIVAATGLTILAGTSVRTTAGPAGVRVHFGALGWPRFRYPLERIRVTEAVDVPFSHAVWGMHWWPQRGVMLTLCAGPALRLTLANGRRITISTPNPAAAAEAIETARSGSPTASVGSALFPAP